MNSTTLESFISFCDEMQIVEEGFKDTKIFTLLKKGWETIKNAVNKLVAKISSFLIKICSKGDKVLVNNEFMEEYRNIIYDITIYIIYTILIRINLMMRAIKFLKKLVILCKNQ